MFHRRQGQGPPLVLVHGLGSTSASWEPVLDRLAAHREVVAVDLPGHGRTPPPDAPATFDALADAVEAFLAQHDLHHADLVGSSIGGRIVLELARRGVGGDVVALDPGGFWGRAGARYLQVTLAGSIRLVRALRPALPALMGNPVTRSALLVQLSARPWAIPPERALAELRRFADTPVFLEVLRDLVDRPTQEGIPAGGTDRRITLVWGRRDRVTPTRQSARAAERFPDAELVVLDRCGHFPHWDRPEEAVGLVLSRTGGPTA